MMQKFPVDTSSKISLLLNTKSMSYEVKPKRGYNLSQDVLQQSKQDIRSNFSNNHGFDKGSSNITLQRIKLDANKLKGLREAVKVNALPYLGRKDSSRRHKHPRVLLPQKNKCKIKAFSVESKQRSMYHKHNRSLSPMNSKVCGRMPSEGPNNTRLLSNVDSLDQESSFMNSFKNFVPKSLDSPSVSERIKNDKSRKHKILEKLQSDQSTLPFKNPLEYIWSSGKKQQNKKMNELQVTKNKFHFSESKNDLNRNYIFSQKHVNESLSKLLREQNQAQSQRKKEDQKSTE